MQPCDHPHACHQACLDHMRANGIPFEGPLVRDEQIHRFSIDSKKNQPDEWYVCYEGVSYKGMPYLICSYGSWANGQSTYLFKSYIDNPNLSQEEIVEIRTREEEKKRLFEQKLKEDQDRRLHQAKEIWVDSNQDPSLPGHMSYLNRKKIKAHGLKFRVEMGGFAVILIPILNIKNEIQGVQIIHEDGSKRIYGLKKGNFYVLGDLQSIQSSKEVYFVEGYATGASVHEATGLPVVVCFDCGNLKAVIAAWRKEYPFLPFTIAADDDVTTEGNPGKSKAEAAAKEYSAKVILPKFTARSSQDGQKYSDFNDLHVSAGLAEVKRQLSAFRFDILSVSDFIELPLPPSDYIITPWLREKSLAMVYAERGIGKTYFALSLAWSIAGGIQFGPWKSIESKRVLYIDGEMPAQLLQERLKALQKGSPIEVNSQQFCLLTPDMQNGPMPNIYTDSDRREIERLLQDYDVVILDNLSTLAYGGEENSADSWGEIQQWLLRLRTQNKTVILIHHAGKNGLARGSSRREDALDVVISLKRPEGYQADEGARFVISFEKARGLVGNDISSMEMQMTSDSDNGIRWTFQYVGSAKWERAVQMKEQGDSLEKIANELGVNKSTVSRNLRKKTASNVRG